tara:strand:+ start:125 stop:574 length:450 start_codon:yes stop_codon:yes gene_type:complete
LSRLAAEFRAIDDAALREKWVYLVQVADSSSISLPEVLASLEQEGAMSAAEVARIVLIDEEEGSEEDEHEEDEHEEDEHEARVSDDVLSSLAEPRGPSPLRLPRRPEIDRTSEALVTTLRLLFTRSFYSGKRAITLTAPVRALSQAHHL